MKQRAFYGRAGRLAAYLVRTDVLGLTLVWAVFFLAVAALTALLAIFGGAINTSVWEQATQIARWYAGGFGVFLTAVYLPLFVAHGHTRRECFLSLPLVLLAFAVMFAILMAVGFWLEGRAYSLFDWEQSLAAVHLYADPADYGWILMEYLLVALVWALGGTMLGAGFYRNPGLGMILIVPAFIMVGIVEGAVGGSYFFVALFSEPADLALGLRLATVVMMTVIALLMIWLTVRRLPLRSKTA